MREAIIVEFDREEAYKRYKQAIEGKEVEKSTAKVTPIGEDRELNNRGVNLLAALFKESWEEYMKSGGDKRKKTDKPTD